MAEQWPPLSWVADKLGYSISGVSLIRHGKRNPTIDLMQLVEEVFSWPLTLQTADMENWLSNLARITMNLYMEENQNEED